MRVRCGEAASRPGTAANRGNERPRRSRSERPMYDLLLKGGTVVDPSTKLDGTIDIAVENGTIARIAPAIDAGEAARTVDVAGKIVTPGLIDLHAHVFEGFNRTGVHPDLGGVYSGVTTIV